MGPIIAAIILGSASRSAALSAAVGGPSGWRVLAMLSSSGPVEKGGRTNSSPWIVAVEAPSARAPAAASAAAALSAGVAPCRGGEHRALKSRGDLAIAPGTG